MTELTPEDLELLELAAAFRQGNRLDFFEPYPKQLEFIGLSGIPHKDEFMFFAGNQLGKTEVGAFIMSCHLTGRYPSWWNGRRFDHPITAWAATVSTQTIREGLQVKLLGENYFATKLSEGYIPATCVIGVNTMRGAGAETAEVVRVRHFDPQGNQDGISTLTMKNYTQGRDKFQARTLDLMWWDEEPPVPLYSEGLARLGATGGYSYMTFTPLLGWSDVVNRFLRDVDPNSRRLWLRMGYREVGHMTEDKIAGMLSKYPKHEHEARMSGVPMLGTGAEFTYPESSLTVPIDMFVPDHWFKLWAIDFGISHPFAAVLLLWDKDRDIVYIWEAFKLAGAIPAVHAQRIQRVAGLVPVAWPHDGHRRDMGSGEQLQQYYRDAGLRMLDTHATFARGEGRGAISTEAALKEMHDRMSSGRFKVRADLNEFWEEYRMYHRDAEGQLVKAQDDILSATMKGIMAKRYGKQEPFGFGNWEAVKRDRRALAAASEPADTFMAHWNMET